MLSTFWREWRFPIEFALLLALAFFLPLREAPKNLFWLAYVVTWVANRAFLQRGERDFGGPWDHWDTLFAAWIVSGYAAALFAGIHTPEGNEWGAVNDLVRYVSLGWCVRRAGYTAPQFLALLMVLLFSCTAGVVEGIWNWRVTGKRKWIELTSVGHVNHSAIYIVICLGLGIGMLTTLWQRLSPVLRTLAAAVNFFLLAAIFAGESRAAVLCALLLLIAIFIAIRHRVKIGLFFWTGVVSAVFLAGAVGGLASVTRQMQNIEANNILSERDLIWNRALTAARAAPWFGVGMDNFSRITDERLKTWVADQERVYVARDFARAPHAHSLYLNTLTERGAVGLALLLTVLVAWGGALWRRLPGPATPAPAALIWCAAFSGWFVTVIIGLVNTTLHHEHAILALLTLAMLIPTRPTPS